MDFLASLLLPLRPMKPVKQRNKEHRIQKKKEANEAVARARTWALNRRKEREKKEEGKKRRKEAKNTKMVKFEGEIENDAEDIQRKQLLLHLLKKEEQVLLETKIKIELIKKELSTFVN
jgi:hypothetical protein